MRSNLTYQLHSVCSFRPHEVKYQLVKHSVMQPDLSGQSWIKGEDALALQRKDSLLALCSGMATDISS